MKTKTQSAQIVNLADADVKHGGLAVDKMEKVVELPLSALKLDPEIQCRAKGVDQKTVERYAERMKARDPFPELEAVEDGNDILLADGFQRHAAALLAGFTSFKVRIRLGTLRDAIELAVTINLKHGRQFQPKDNRRAVVQLLKHSPDRSDGAIAEMCHVSQSYVSRIHRQLRTVLSCDGGKSRIGRDGRKRKPPQKKTPINESTQQSPAQDDAATPARESVQLAQELNSKRKLLKKQEVKPRSTRETGQVKGRVFSFRLDAKEEAKIEQYLQDQPIQGVGSGSLLSRKLVLDYVDGRLVYPNPEDRKRCS